ncbi:Fe-S cluster assembly ATPase SufC [Candidatus Comchoanobacter bicostacola]|uniref:Fe-S cluster assembly ATPase SufC n=1 Tax=Candidatus Comchoanobacter bicostacola TaxID=2919598 RepID=A0ABY5DIB2_9GAMM|nr:Fe-S cluster assembly ATPase SufC [Candidatus Comchoanobacter bicostacola]UTC24376.1 Fe-S cluster assembly ATPase SufC [Candidatus Comchoanobacter bicostacola]
MLSIKKLSVSVEDKEIIRDLSFNLAPGTVCALMGPNGSGKSTLANALAGHPDYKLSGSVVFDRKNLLEMAINERALEGLFLAFQSPVAIPGVNNLVFLQTLYNNLRKHRNQEPLDATDFIQYVNQCAKQVGLDASFWSRGVNDDFSGGEKKRNDLLQMLLMDPKLMVLDEIDSGLDVDALKKVATIVNQMRKEGKSFILITHYQRLLDYIRPDEIHVMSKGRIVSSGDYSLVSKIEKEGYGWLETVS